MGVTFRRVRVITEDSLDTATTQLVVTDGTHLRQTLYELINEAAALVGGDDRPVTTSVLWDATANAWLNRPLSLARTARQVFQWVESPGVSPDPRGDDMFSAAHDLVTVPDYTLISASPPTGSGFGTSFGSNYGQ